MCSSDLMLYIDASAFVAAVSAEPGTRAMRAMLDAGHPTVASALLEIEAARALAGTSRDVRARADALLESVDLVAIDRAVIAKAAHLAPGVRLRSPDAIHLATALSMPEPVAMLTLDQRLLAASLVVGLRPAI